MALVVVVVALVAAMVLATADEKTVAVESAVAFVAMMDLLTVVASAIANSKMYSPL